MCVGGVGISGTGPSTHKHKVHVHRPPSVCLTHTFYLLFRVGVGLVFVCYLCYWWYLRPLCVLFDLIVLAYNFRLLSVTMRPSMLGCSLSWDGPFSLYHLASIGH